MEINWKVVGIIAAILLIGGAVWVFAFKPPADVSKIRQLAPPAGGSVILMR